MSELADSYLLPISLAELADRLAASGNLVEREAAGQDWATAAAFIPRHLSLDSRDVKDQTLFFCKGEHFQADYLKAALAGGARAYVSERAWPMDAPALLVADVRRAMAQTAAWYYARLREALTIVGITGTKGKSTTVYFLKAILDAWLAELGQPQSAILSSIDNYDGVRLEESHLTTQESLDLYGYFANATSSGIRYLSMEVSSQALKFQRVGVLQFDASCFLNFGRDHISAIEHPDIEDYLQSKLLIFAQSQATCVNLGTDRVDQVLAAARRVPRLVTFGWSEAADIHALTPASGVRGLAAAAAKNAAAAAGEQPGANRFTASLFGRPAEFQLSLIGRFNVENALAALAIASLLEIPLSAMQSGLAAAHVPGRMELFELPSGRLVIVDYAHNQMSFEALFAAVNQSYGGRSVSVVFGCPGYKALDRRQDLGSIAGRYAQDVVLTEEDAGAEPALAICTEIAQAVQSAGGQARIILNRQQAIASAIAQAPADGVILVTGKGRETRQKRGDSYVEVTSDVAIVQACQQAELASGDLDWSQLVPLPGYETR